MNPILDQIQDLPEEDKEKYHQYVQKSLRRKRREIKDKTEIEIDLERNRK